MGHTGSITSLRSSLARQRDIRLQRRHLARQLADFDTPSAQLELEAMVARHSAEDTQEIRTIMRQLAAERSTR